jgi:hypothetical protein
MIRIQDFLGDPDLERKYGPELVERMQDPSQAEWLIREYLMQAGDQIQIEENPVPHGVQISYTIIEPSGKWHRLHFLKRLQAGDPRPEELEWLNRERKKIQYRQNLRLN